MGNNFTTVINSTGTAGTYDTSMSVSGFFTTELPLTSTSGVASGNLSGHRDIGSLILGYSFNDGRQVLDQSNSTLSQEFLIDANGVFTEWNFSVFEVDPSPHTASDIGNVINRQIATTFASIGSFTIETDQGHIRTCLGPIDFFGDCSGGVGDNGGQDQAVVSNHGTWTSDAITTVPVPATVWLFSSGLLGLVGMTRRKRAA